MKAKLKFEQITITPDGAKKMLQKNFGNRTMSLRHVTFLANEIIGGRWKVNGDPIRFGKDGRLLDGQHRLAAVVKSGKPIESVVISGFGQDIFDTIDCGKKRCAADALSCLGEKNSVRVASALTLVDRYLTCRLGRSHSRVYSNTEVEALLDKHPGIRESIMTGVKAKGLIFGSIVDACNYLFRQKDQDLAELFFRRVLRGISLSDNDPEYVLRSRLVKNATATAKLDRITMFALCVKAWNAVRSGRKIKALRWDDDEDFPTII